MHRDVDGVTVSSFFILNSGASSSVFASLIFDFLQKEKVRNGHELKCDFYLFFNFIGAQPRFWISLKKIVKKLV